MTGLPCRIAYPENFSFPKDNSLQVMLIKSCKNTHINCAIKEEKTLEPALFEEKEIEVKPQETAPQEPKKTPVKPQKQAPLFGKIKTAVGSVVNSAGGLFDYLYDDVKSHPENDQ